MRYPRRNLGRSLATRKTQLNVMPKQKTREQIYKGVCLALYFENAFKK
jgi:hypothetical protein